MPPTATVNFGAGEDRGNTADIRLGGPTGTVLVQSIVATHLVVDVYGYYTDVEVQFGFNTVLGVNALLNRNAALQNTAIGANALMNTTIGSLSTAVGANALIGNTTGGENTAVGNAALSSNSTGHQNTAVGNAALSSNSTGLQNTAVGFFALSGVLAGQGNTAIGVRAGANVTGLGSNNIHIGHSGFGMDTALIRIGTAGTQTATFIAGISGVPVAGVPVMVDGSGQLGVAAASSRRVKDDIRDMDEASTGLGKLRPVTFRYKAEPATGPRPIEYGLIAEEVAEIYPELVVLDTDGQPAGVRYHVLPAMLLNELQRQQRVIEELTTRLSRLEAKGAAAAGR